MLQPLLDSPNRAGVWIDVLRRALLPNTSPVETDLLPGLYRDAISIGGTLQARVFPGRVECFDYKVTIWNGACG